MCYLHVYNGKINGGGDSLSTTENTTNIKVSKDIYEDYLENPNKYQPNVTLDDIELNPNFEQEEKAKEP